MAKRVYNPEGMPRDPSGRNFVRGAQDGAIASHFRSDSAGQTPTARELAEANILLVKTQIEQLERIARMAPWRRASKKDRKGRLYTLSEVARQVDTNKAVANAKKQEGLSKASKARERELQRERALQGWRRGIRGPNTGGNPVTDVLLETWLSRRIDEDRRRAGKLRGPGRRGALSTRPTSTTGTARTNRTGARASQRGTSRTASGPGGSAVSRTGEPVRSASGSAGREGGAIRSVSRTSGTVADAQARGIMGTSQRLPTKTTTQGTRSWAENQLSRLLSRQQTTGSRQLSGSRMRTSSTRVSKLSNARVPRSSLSSNTAMTSTQNPLTSGTQASLLTGNATAHCKCPATPKKKDKESEPRCSNPVVSKKIADGFITTKRRIECQPFRQK